MSLTDRATRSAGRPRRASIFRETAEAWSRLGLYERFEQVVSLALTMVIGAIVVVAVVHLFIEAGRLVAGSLLDPVEHATYQGLFGMILTVLIALEFNHTILAIVQRRESIIQLKTVMMIALLAIARKFIVIDATKADPMTVIGLAAAVLALGCVYWMVREQDARRALDRSAPAAPPSGRFDPGAGGP